MTLDEIFIINIELERTRLGYTQTEMASALDMTLSRYKKMVLGHMTNIPKFEISIALYPYTHKTVYELCGCVPQGMQPLIDYNKLPLHRRITIDSMISTELRLHEESPVEDLPQGAHRLHSSADYTTCYVLSGNMKDGMLFDAASYKEINVSKYRHICPESIDCALEITSTHLHPAYHLGDILLVHKDAPRDGDTGIFINTRTKRLYIRRYRQTQPARLEPITPYGSTITFNGLTDAAEWIKFGYIMTKMH